MGQRYLSKKDIQIVKKYMKLYSTFFIIKEIQIKTTMWYHRIPFRLATIKNIKKIKVGITWWSIN